jgi:hypothetical protein
VTEYSPLLWFDSDQLIARTASCVSSFVVRFTSDLLLSHGWVTKHAAEIRVLIYKASHSYISSLKGTLLLDINIQTVYITRNNTKTDSCVNLQMYVDDDDDDGNINSNNNDNNTFPVCPRTKS